MKINIKNLKGEHFSVDIQPSKTIADLKLKIQQLKGSSAASQKIIFKGKTTNDDDQIDKLNLKETDFLVIMIQIAKPESKPKVEEKVQSSLQPPSQKKEAQPVLKIQTRPEPNQQLEAQIYQLMSMGFPRGKCVSALKAAFNNSERAVQYLLNGTTPYSETGAMNLTSLSQLTSLPEFAQMRQMINNDPNSWPVILQQLSETSPQLYNIIAEHPEQFQRLIEQPEEGSQIDVELDGVEDSGQLQIQQAEESQQVMISQEDDAAINRLSALGFNRLEAAQAYIACDKNEQMAANLLFDRLANGDIQQSNEEYSSSHDNEDDDNLFN